MIPSPMDDSEGFKASGEEVTPDVVETARALDLELEPEVVTGLLQSHDNTLIDKEFLLIEEQRK